MELVLNSKYIIYNNSINAISIQYNSASIRRSSSSAVKENISLLTY